MKLSKFVRNNLTTIQPNINWQMFNSIDDALQFVDASDCSYEEKVNLKFLLSFGRRLKKIQKPLPVRTNPHWERNELINCNDQYWIEEIRKRGGKILIDTKGFPPYRVFKRLHRQGRVLITRERSYTVNKTFVVLKNN